MYILKKLYTEEIFRKEFDKLKKKYKGVKYREKSNVNKEFSLNWVLDHEDYIIKELIKTLKYNRYSTPVAKETKALIGDKERLLYQFDWPEKVLQGALASLLAIELEKLYPDVLNSYRKGRGIFYTLKRIKAFVKASYTRLYVYRNDISSYGDSIKHEILFKILRKYIKEENLIDILKKMLGFKYIEFASGRLMTKQEGLPTGSPINNIMTNLYLIDLDKTIEQYLGDDALYYRYGDDIIIMSKNEEKYKKIKNILESTVIDKKLQLNQEKKIETVFIKNGPNIQRKVKYLGFIMDKEGNFSLTENKRREFKSRVRGVLRKAFRLSYRDFRTDEEKILVLLKSLNTLFLDSNFLDDLSQYMKLIDNKDFWKKIDLWIAKELLHFVYKSKNLKVLFQKYSLEKLRKNGLLSLNYLRFLYLYDKVRFNKILEKYRSI